MSIYDIDHIVCLLVRPIVEGRELWAWPTWQTIFAATNIWVAEPDIVHVESHQTRISTRKPVVFSGLRWSVRDCQKWTHRSPLTLAQSADWLFGSTHVDVPSWQRSVDADVSPTLYLELKSRTLNGVPSEMILVSISTEREPGDDVPESLRRLFSELKIGDESVAIYTRRPFVRRRRDALVRSVHEITHSDVDRVASVDAINHASREMDKRCRVESAPWIEVPE